MIRPLPACRLPRRKVFPQCRRSREYWLSIQMESTWPMESTWTKADFRNYGKLQGASSELLRSTQEVLGRELGLSLSAFLRCSVTSVFKSAEERSFGDLQKHESQSCLGSALVRPFDSSLFVQMDYSILYQLIGIALGAKLGSFSSPERKPTDIELQVVNILFRLILSEAYRG